MPMHPSDMPAKPHEPMGRLLTCALALIWLLGCTGARETDYGAALIASPGTFRCFHDQLVIKVVRDGDRLNYSVANSRAAAGPASAGIANSSLWTIFPESPERAWVYGGASDVTLIEIYPDGGSKFTSSQVIPNLLERAPPKFVDRLPTEALEKTRVADDSPANSRMTAPRWNRSSQRGPPAVSRPIRPLESRGSSAR